MSIVAPARSRSDRAYNLRRCGEIRVGRTTGPVEIPLWQAACRRRWQQHYDACHNVVGAGVAV